MWDNKLAHAEVNVLLQIGKDQLINCDYTLILN